MCWSLFLKSCRPSGLQLYLKETPAQVFSCEYCQIFKNTYFEEPLRTALFTSLNQRQTELLFSPKALIEFLLEYLAHNSIRIFLYYVFI